MVSMAFYGFLIYLIYKNVKNKYLKWISITILSLLITLIGISRIYLGVHYTSDVLGGFLISISYLIVFTNFLPRKRRKFTTGTEIMVKNFEITIEKCQKT